MTSNQRSARDLDVPVEIGLAHEDGYSVRGLAGLRRQPGEHRHRHDVGARRLREQRPPPERRGSSCASVLPIGDPTHSLLVSERAVGTDQGTKYVLVVNDQNVVEYRPVKLGPLSEGLRVIREGLKPGERVIVAGIQRGAAGHHREAARHAAARLRRRGAGGRRATAAGHP